MVEVVGQRGQDEVLTTGRAQVEAEMKMLTQQAATQAGLGVVVEAIDLGQVAVPAPVMASFLDVISADEDRQTNIHLADAYAATVLPRSRGRAQALLAEAEGTAAWTLAVTDGEVLLLEELSKGGRASPRLTRERLSLEATERSLAGARVVVVGEDLSLWTGEPPLPESSE